MHFEDFSEIKDYSFMNVFGLTIGISTFVIAGATARLIAWITVSYQSFKAAIVNPVDWLASE